MFPGGNGENFGDDPLVCSPMDCAVSPVWGGDYSLQPDSPALAENNPCGVQIGATSGICATSGVKAPSIAGLSPQMRVAPHPVTEAVTIEFHLESPTPVVLEVHSVTGRKLQTVFDGVGQVGLNRIEWDRTPDGIANGVVFVRLLQAGVETTRRKVVLLP